MLRRVARHLPDALADPLREATRWLGGLRRSREFRRVNPNVTVHPTARLESATFGQYVIVSERAYLYRAHLDDHTYAAESACLMDVRFGKFCSIGPNSSVGLPQHPTRGYVSTHPAFYQAAPQRYLDYVGEDQVQLFKMVTVGHDVWIGAAAMVMGGLSIGHGAVIGAGSVVTKDVPPYAVCVGVPAKVIRYRFSPDTVEFLLSFGWWDKDETWLRANCRLFRDEKIFKETFRQPRAAGPGGF